jgi:hypothetical protein
MALNQDSLDRTSYSGTNEWLRQLAKTKSMQTKFGRSCIATWRPMKLSSSAVVMPQHRLSISMGLGQA